MERVSFVNKISSVMKATADNEEPTPGYLYPEIANISLESDGACESLLEFLVDRLDRNSYHVKLKVLKLMKYVVENGHKHFVMGLRKKSRGIKEATSFGGPPDPLHGNIPYILVRKAAKDLSELVFDTEVENVSQHSQNPPLKSTGGMGGFTRSQRMEGFGSSPVTQKNTLGNTIMTGLNKLAEKVTDSASSEALPPSVAPSYGEYTPVQMEPGTVTLTHNISTPPVAVQPAPRKHIPGRAGGGWDDEPGNNSTVDVKLSSESRSNESQGQIDRYESTSSSEDWSNEEHLVSETTDKPDSFLLSRAEINHFLKKCPGVNCEKTVDIISKHLVGSPDQITVKCLQLIEGLLRCDLVSLEFMAVTCRENLVSTFHRECPHIKAKAKKIIRILEKLTSHVSILPHHQVSSVTNSVKPSLELSPHGFTESDQLLTCDTGNTVDSADDPVTPTKEPLDSAENSGVLGSAGETDCENLGLLEEKLISSEMNDIGMTDSLSDGTSTPTSTYVSAFAELGEDSQPVDEETVEQTKYSNM